MRRSVICHTNDLNNNSVHPKTRPPNLYSIQNILSSKTRTENVRKHQQPIEEKDSGFEDDDESGRASEASGEPYTTTSSINEELPESFQYPVQYMHQDRHNHSPPSSEYFKSFQLVGSSSNEFKRRFESSVLSALKDPQIQYLLTLYSFVDEDLLKNTLLKFLQGSCLDIDTSNAAENYLQKDNSLHNKPDIVVESTSPEIPLNGSKTKAFFDYISQYKHGKNSSVLSTENNGQSHDINMFQRDHYLAREDSNQLSSPFSSTSNKPTNIPVTRCEYCQKLFSNEQSLKRHLRTHEGKRIHKCSQCSRSFYDQASYLRHVRSHSGDKKHKCEQCSMAFNKRSALEVHIRTHTGERPFVCKYCGKGFSISGNLHRHVLIHTGHRPYKCGKCPRAFNNPSHLARHINSFHT